MDSGTPETDVFLWIFLRGNGVLKSAPPENQCFRGGGFGTENQCFRGGADLACRIRPPLKTWFAHAKSAPPENQCLGGGAKTQELSWFPPELSVKRENEKRMQEKKKVKVVLA